MGATPTQVPSPPAGFGLISILAGFQRKNGVMIMRMLMIATAAALLLLPATAQITIAHAAQVASTDYAAAKKKPVKTAKKKQPKVEYMRAVPVN